VPPAGFFGGACDILRQWFWLKGVVGRGESGTGQQCHVREFHDEHRKIVGSTFSLFYRVDGLDQTYLTVGDLGDLIPQETVSTVHVEIT
jgi:hypothetical protein